MKKFNKLMFLCLFIYFISCSADVNVTKCEMNVKQGNTNIPCGSGYFNFGNIPLNFSQSITFTIENVGISDLNLTGNPKVEVSGQNASDFSAITNLTASTIEADSETTFKIHFKPTSIGSKSATVSISNDDKKRNPYIFTIIGTCTAQAAEIHIKQGDTDILCTTGSFDFGTVGVNFETDKVTFTIENNGNENLQLTGTNNKVAVIGTDTSVFHVNEDGILATISGGNSTTFNVIFKPTSPGIKTAQISIFNDDSDENPYTFTITGTGIASPEINVKQGSENLPNDSGKYIFIDTLVNESTEVTYTIENLGTSTLQVTSIEFSGSDAVMFSENTTSTDENIAQGSSTTFGIIFTPTSISSKTATVSIANNDADENPYTFTIEGKGVVSEINIKQGSDNITNSTGTFDFGGVIVNTSGPEIEFTIENLGDGILKLSGSPIIEITGMSASEFSVTMMPSLTTISPGNNTTFKIQSRPVSKGQKTATVSIVNNDDDENPYTFTITAYGSIYTEGDVNGDGIPDIVVGAYKERSIGTNVGCAYIFFGRQNWTNKFDASNADVKLAGKSIDEYFGVSVSLVGDVNKDGFEDVVVGAYRSDEGNRDAGCAYIFFGRLNWSSNLSSSNANVQLMSSGGYDYFGYSIANKLDANNDGIDDIVVGAYRDDDGGEDSGCAFIFFGRHTWAKQINSSSADVKLVGEDAWDYFACNVSSAGDINKDGIDDILVGAYWDDDGGSSSGCAFIFFGRSSWSSTIDASNANVKLVGENPSDNFGFWVSNAGDVNNDSIDDIIIGAFDADDGGSGSGSAYIFFGRTSWSSTINASNANVSLIGENSMDRFSFGMSTAGDINNDGIDDVIVGARDNGNNGNQSGSSYIFFGRTNWQSTIDASIADVIIASEAIRDNFGYCVSNLYDINNDGLTDLIVGAVGNDEGLDGAGAAYIFYGKSNWTSTNNASQADVKLIGESAGNSFGNSVSSN